MAQIQSGYHLAIIGSGSAAFAAAIAARSDNRSVVMVESGVTGGTCVNVGCVPSKALLAAAEARHGAGASDRFPGISTHVGEVDMQSLINGKDTLVDQMRAEKYVDLAADYGWEIVRGTASFIDGPALKVELATGGEIHLEAEHYLIATGATAWTPPIPGLAEAGYLTSTTSMDLTKLPESLAILGGNAIGLEQAQLFARLGSKVTVIEALDRLAPFEEPEISEMIESIFAQDGIDVHTATKVTEVRRDAHGYVLTTTRDGLAVELRTEQLLVATGRRPSTAGLNVESVGVKVGDRGQVLVDNFLRTDNERIWAAGDVTGGAQFVYVAAAQGKLAADNALFGAKRTLDYASVPRVIFTSPAIASVGMTDAQVIEAGLQCDCRTLPLEYVPRALVNRETRGLIKLVAEASTGKLLGAHIIAENAGDVITAAVYAINAGMTVEQIANVWTPYLTMSESLKLAAQSYGRDVTKLSCCAA